MFLAMPGMKETDGRFLVLIETDKHEIFRAKLADVTQNTIQQWISNKFNVPLNRVIFKEEKTPKRGPNRGMTTISYMVIPTTDNTPAPF